MKKLIMTAIAMSLCSGYLMADGAAESSFTLTNDNKSLAMIASTATIPHVLIAVIVSSTSSGGTLKIFNSSYTTAGASTVTVIGLDTVQRYEFHDIRLKGISYVTANNSHGVTIIYKQ